MEPPYKYLSHVLPLPQNAVAHGVARIKNQQLAVVHVHAVANAAEDSSARNCLPCFILHPQPQIATLVAHSPGHGPGARVGVERLAGHPFRPLVLAGYVPLVRVNVVALGKAPLGIVPTAR